VTCLPVSVDSKVELLNSDSRESAVPEADDTKAPRAKPSLAAPTPATPAGVVLKDQTALHVAARKGTLTEMMCCHDALVIHTRCCNILCSKVLVDPELMLLRHLNGEQVTGKLWLHCSKAERMSIQ